MIIRARKQTPANERPPRIEGAATERCGLCWDVWPPSMMTDEDGMRRCPDCIETTGPTRTAMLQAHDAAMIAAKQTRPQISRAPLSDSTPAHIRVMEDASGNRVTQNAPLGLARGGAAVQLIVKGGDFASSDSFTYSSGISNSVAPSLSGSTQWTLTLVASGGMTPGFWHLTFNNHTYRGILRAL